jgi:hypothetical protein
MYILCKVYRQCSLPSVLSMASTQNCRWVLTFCAMYYKLERQHLRGME